jgi:hypothetical protein
MIQKLGGAVQVLVSQLPLSLVVHVLTRRLGFHRRLL